MHRALPLVLAAALLPSVSAAQPDVVRVAAAANLRVALEEIIAGFRAKNPAHDVRPNFGASGTFFAQIENGAPFDVFLSAEATMPKRLAAEGRTVGPAFVYAIGKLVLWVPKDSKLDIDKLGAKALLDPSVRFISIGNPALAPYGAAAESALKAAGVYEALKERLVRGNDIQQAAQFVYTGNAQAGFLPLALVVSPPLSKDGRYVLVPGGDYDPIEQAGVILKEGAAARKFVQYLLGADGRAALEKYGYGLRGTDRQSP